jgi:ribosome biogenesis protein Nip4
VQVEEEGNDMIERIRDFVDLFGAEIRLDEDLLVRRVGKFYLLNEELRKTVREGFFYAGLLLGAKKNGEFKPSFELLRMIAEGRANKVVVDSRTEWLFICGRDIFKRGIVDMEGSKREGDYVVVLNETGDCLGFGKIVSNLDNVKNKVFVKNMLDIGDFLRRERTLERIS